MTQKQSIQIKMNCFHSLSVEFDLEVHVSDDCTSCYGRGGQCVPGEMGKFYCDNAGKCTFQLVLKVLSITLLRS